MNRITRIEGLNNLTLLEKLFLYGNDIAVLEGLENLKKLKELHINRNRIRDTVSRLVYNDKLELLNASHNKIPESELENIAHLVSCLSQIRSLDLYGNPLSQHQTYKYRLCANAAGTLERFDGLNLKAGSFMRDRLDQMKKEEDTNRLI